MQEGESDLASAMRVLEAQGWFSRRSRATRALLASIAKLRHFAKNERVYLAGDPPNGVYGLVRGSLNVSFPRADGEDYTIHRAGAGFWIGDMALLSNESRLVSLHAAEPTVMVHLADRDIKKLVRIDPRLYADFYALSYENVHTALRLVSNLAIPSPDKRLADRLILELEASGDVEGWVPLSQPELAKLLAVSVPTLQRVVRRFINDGLLLSSYGRLRVLDREALVKLCTDQSSQHKGRKP